MTEVLKNCEVGELWIHRPWWHIDEIFNYIENDPNISIDGRVTKESLKKRFENEYYKYAKELEIIANERGVAINEPYQRRQIGSFCVLSPNKEWHLSDLIPNSDKTQEIMIESYKAESFGNKIKQNIFSVVEQLGVETLKDGGVTSRENESSVILYAIITH